MKNKIILLIAVVALSSCSLLKKLDVKSTEQVYKLTEYKYDEYSKERAYISPDLSIGTYSEVMFENNDYFLFALPKENKKKNSDWQIVIKVNHYCRDWKFLKDVYMKGFEKVQSSQLDRIVRSGGRVVESIMIPLTDKHIEYSKINGIDFKISGDRGSTKVFITKEQLNGFLKKVEEDKRETIDEQW